jgi:hypothetical protein
LFIYSLALVKLQFADGTVVTVGRKSRDLLYQGAYQYDMFLVPEGDSIVQAVIRYDDTGAAGIRFKTLNDIRFPGINMGFYGGYGPNETVFEAKLVDEELCGFTAWTGFVTEKSWFHFGLPY